MDTVIELGEDFVPTETATEIIQRGRRTHFAAVAASLVLLVLLTIGGAATATPALRRGAAIPAAPAIREITSVPTWSALPMYTLAPRYSNPAAIAPSTSPKTSLAPTPPGAP